MSARFKQSVVDCGNSSAVLLYDLEKLCLVRDVTDYAAHLMDDLQLVPLTVDQEISHLRNFLTFASASNVRVEAVDDEFLKLFRTFALKAVRGSASHRGVLEVAHRTVNAKLIRIYRWLRWLVDKGRAPRFLIGGQNCRVTSALSATGKESRKAWAAKLQVSSTLAYPLLLTVPSGSSKHGMPKYVPTEETVDQLHEIFFTQASSEFLAHRNALIVDIASATGFRRASLNSLEVTQFSTEKCVITDNGTVLIRPKLQKFGYSNTFEISAWLYQRVTQFIEHYLLPFLAKKKASRKCHQDRLFISSRDARPLTDRAITELVSAALRKTGATKGAAPHSFRHKFIREEVDSDIENRLALGLDTSTTSIAQSIALKVGHRSPTSHLAYISASESSRGAKQRAERANQVVMEKNRVVELEKELATLKSELARYCPPTNH